MPRYFFNVYDGADMFDEEGTELQSVKEMRLYMMTMATQIVTDAAFNEDVWQMEVLDENGKIVATMDFGLADKLRG